MRLEAGDCVLLPNGRRFCLTNDLASQPTPFDQLHSVAWRGGITTLNGGGDTTILGGHSRSLARMPTFCWAPCRRSRTCVTTGTRGTCVGPWNRCGASWPKNGRAGLVAQHLAHMMLVQALRLYLTGSAGSHVGWLFALADPKLAAAIGAMHAQPGADWTLPAPAEKAGMSRSSFARAFETTIGTSARPSSGMGCSPGKYARSGPPFSSRHPWATTAISRTTDGG